MNKILSIIKYGSLLYGALALAFQLPQLQELVPQFTTEIAVTTGVPAGILAGALQFVQTYITTARATDNTINKNVADGLSNLKGEVIDFAKETESNVNKFVAAQDRQTQAILELAKQTKRNNQLLEVDLRAKLSNELIEQAVRNEIEGVLNES